MDVPTVSWQRRRVRCRTPCATRVRARCTRSARMPCSRCDAGDSPYLVTPSEIAPPPPRIPVDAPPPGPRRRVTGAAPPDVRAPDGAAPGNPLTGESRPPKGSAVLQLPATFALRHPTGREGALLAIGMTLPDGGAVTIDWRTGRAGTVGVWSSPQAAA